LTVDDAELARLLDELQDATDLPHVRRMTTAVAIISTALRARGMEATLVGGGAIEFHAPGAYTTSDIDLVVEGKTRVELDAALQALAMIAAFGDSLDEHLLRQRLRAEDAEDAYDALRRIAARQVAITDDLLQAELERLGRRQSSDEPGRADGR
jgi:hypothetical protein